MAAMVCVLLKRAGFVMEVPQYVKPSAATAWWWEKNHVTTGRRRKVRAMAATSAAVLNPVGAAMVSRLPARRHVVTES